MLRSAEGVAPGSDGGDGEFSSTSVYRNGVAAIAAVAADGERKIEEKALGTGLVASYCSQRV